MSRWRALPGGAVRLCVMPKDLFFFLKNESFFDLSQGNDPAPFGFFRLCPKDILLPSQLIPLVTRFFLLSVSVTGGQMAAQCRAEGPVQSCVLHIDKYVYERQKTQKTA